MQGKNARIQTNIYTVTNVGTHAVIWPACTYPVHVYWNIVTCIPRKMQYFTCTIGQDYRIRWRGLKTRNSWLNLQGKNEYLYIYSSPCLFSFALYSGVE